MAVIGIDLGGTKLAGAVLDSTGSILERTTADLVHRGGPDVGGLIAQMIRDLSTKARSMGRAVTDVGISVPGIAHASSGTVWAPNIPGWNDYPLRDELSKAFSADRLNILIDSDRACSILGEQWKGAARGCQHAIYLAVGTGIGAGILIDGKVLRGAQDIAGATGWMALMKPFIPEYVACGCFEYHASGEGIAKVAKKLRKEQPAYRGILAATSDDELTAHDVFEAYDAGDVIAKATMAQAIQSWGAAAANFVSLFNPERIVFGGGVFGPAVRFLDDIRREATKWAQPISMKSVEFVASELGGDAPLIGAASLFLRSNG